MVVREREPRDAYEERDVPLTVEVTLDTLSQESCRSKLM